MSKEARYEALLIKHRELDHTIEALEAERAPDQYVSQRKKEKLKMKQEIESLKKELGYEK